MIRNIDIKALFSLVRSFDQAEQTLLDECAYDVARSLYQKEIGRQSTHIRFLPEIEVLIEDAAENLLSRGITVENLYIHTLAVSLAWQALDWLKPHDYDSEEKQIEIFSEIFRKVCPESSYLFAYEGETKGDGLRINTGSSQIVFLRTNSEESVELEIYPTVFTRSYTLGARDGNDSFFELAGETTTLRIRHEDGILAELGLSYYDENGENPREYIYRYISDERQEQKPREILSLEQIAVSLETPKIDAREIRKYLSDNGVRCFYHFTDARNMDSIRKNGGLLSWYYLDTHRIRVENPGGNKISRELDMNNMSQDFVRISLGKNNPMLYRKRKESPNAQFVWLKISPEVATFRDTRFSDMNATAKGHNEGTRLSDLKRIDIPATRKAYMKRDDPKFAYSQAEVMCRTFIPSKYILNIDKPEIIK